MARVHALIRRSSAGVETDKLSYGSAVLHLRSRTLEVRSHLISLSSKEFLLLEYLFRHPGQVLTRDQLVAHVWGPDAVVSEHALDTYVYFLRKKAAALGWRNIIQTVRGFGYTLGTPL
ncbi:MAG: response regulator transcription factor [Alicyclobacillus sp.]|nr:response regulator transcription factor [Alicyclobacillus sp.]